MVLHSRHSDSYTDVSMVGTLAQQPDRPGRTLSAVQIDENDQAEVVLVCEPEGTSLMMGGLHPRASLYERPVNLDDSKMQHAKFREVLREHGIKVLTVRDVLSFAVERHVGARVELEELAMKALKYELQDEVDHKNLTTQDRCAPVCVMLWIRTCLCELYRVKFGTVPWITFCTICLQVQLPVKNVAHHGYMESLGHIFTLSGPL